MIVDFFDKETQHRLRKGIKLTTMEKLKSKGIGMLIPVFSIVFLVLANRAIQKDEALVKSVNRLR